MRPRIGLSSMGCGNRRLVDLFHNTSSQTDERIAVNIL
jgi:hypothetical protein